MEFLTREEVRQELQALGVNPDEAMQRATTLSSSVFSLAMALRRSASGRRRTAAIIPETPAATTASFATAPNNATT